MDRRTVYIETSIVSYLTARPSSNLLAAAWQKATIDWWDTQRERFNLYVSATVIEEAKKGDSQAAARRVEVVENIALLQITEAVAVFAKLLINEKALPKKALDDALHIAVSAVT